MPEVKKLLFDRFLRKNGKEDSPIVELDGLELQIFAGQKVDTGAKDPVTEMIGGNPVTWVFVSAKDGVDANAKKGFVAARDLVDEGVEVLTSGGYVPFPKEVEKAAFADACFVHAELNRTNPAYLYALAFVQSGDRWSETSVKTDDPADAVALGAYRFTREAWTKFLALPELAGLTVESIASPTAQCVVAGVLAAKSATLLKGLITDHGLSAIDLYLAHIFNDDGTFGSSAADKMLQAEKADPTQPSLNVIKKVYDDDAARTASLKRNKAIFKEDGSATIKEAIQTCVDKFTAAFEEVKKLAHEIEKSVPSDADNPIFGIQFSGKMVSITDQDVDALARVGESEVGNFDEKFGVQMFTDAIGAVIDTVFNRMIYPSTEFPKTIQGVINQPKQFSAINDLGTWEKLPKPSDKHFQIALHHIQNRARGTASQIKGATHFFNPTSHPSWGEPIRAHPIASYGVPPDSHIHGFPANYHPPRGPRDSTWPGCLGVLGRWAAARTTHQPGQIRFGDRCRGDERMGVLGQIGSRKRRTRRQRSPVRDLCPRYLLQAAGSASVTGGHREGRLLLVGGDDLLHDQTGRHSSPGVHDLANALHLHSRGDQGAAAAGCQQSLLGLPSERQGSGRGGWRHYRSRKDSWDVVR
jgi:spore germination cell wall hydrolase CwlJ-like protein